MAVTTDPELAKAIIESVVTATDAVAVDTITREQETLRAQREQFSREYAQEQLNVLLQEYPNAPEVFKNPAFASSMSLEVGIQILVSRS